MRSLAEYVDGRWIEVRRGDFKPFATAELSRDLRGYLADLDAYLAPGRIEAIALRLDVLLSHWRASDQDETVRAMAATDWLTIIGRYPEWAVEQACADWLSEEHSRPQIAHIRRYCDALVNKYTTHAAALRRVLEENQ